MKGRGRKPKSCPECDGDLKWIIRKKYYICTSCGLQLTSQELMELRNKKWAKEEGKDEIQEYVKWWLSSKDEKRGEKSGT